MAGRPPSGRRGPTPDADAELRCDGCGRQILRDPLLSLTGRALCSGCAERLDAATMALMTMNGVCATGATALWLNRADRSRATQAGPGETPR